MRNSKIRILGNERNLFSVEREASNAPLFRQIDLTKAVATLATGMPFLRHLTIIRYFDCAARNTTVLAVGALAAVSLRSFSGTAVALGIRYQAFSEEHADQGQKSAVALKD